LLNNLSEAGAALGELGRGAARSGRFFFWTSNRFSVAPEPNVRIWGVGFLPRRWMPAYVKWMRGMAYEKKYLLSCSEIRRLLKRAGLDSVEFSLPLITKSDWASLRGLERTGARLFTLIGSIRFLRRVLVTISPVIQLVARRRQTLDAAR